jgi:hypothetical protein
MELVLLGCLFSECHNLFFGLSLILRKGHPFANDFSARLVVVHVRGSFAHLIYDSRARPRVTHGAALAPQFAAEYGPAATSSPPKSMT